MTLGVSLLFLWLLAGPALAQTIRIMPMGGPETAGDEGFASYRYDLWFLLDDAGYDVDFVGTQSVAIITPNPAEYPLLYTTFDGDHEGRFDGSASNLASISTASITAEQPDILLLFGGRQEIYDVGAPGIDTAIGFLALIIDIARSINPAVIVLLAQPPPDERRNNQFVPSFNERIAQLGAEKTTAESPVVVVDLYTGFDVDTMWCCPTGYSPSRAGEMFIASRWFAALETVLLDPTGGSSFQINAGLNDAWYNSTTPGQGFFFNVFPDLGLMFAAWFTYDTERPPENIEALLGEPGHRWVTGIGPYDGDTANIVLELTQGGVFDMGDPPVMQTQGYGTMDIEFQDCQFATVTYNMPTANVSGSINVQRIVPDNIPLCESMAGGGGAAR